MTPRACRPRLHAWATDCPGEREAIHTHDQFRRGVLATLLAASAFCFTAHAEDSAFFDAQVAPLLAGRCLECHSAGGKGGLDLRSRVTAFTGEGGAVIVAAVTGPQDPLVIPYEPEPF